MTYKLQLSPLSGTSDSQAGISLGKPQSTVSPSFQDLKFYHWWLFYDLDGCRDTNWSAVLGLTLATVLSAGFWTCVGLVAVRYWK